MAANPKKLRIVGARLDNPSTRVLVVECIEGEPFARIGGEYVIVHTGLGADGKPVKRAYSMMPVPQHPDRAQLTVKRLGAGLGSNALHDALIGRELTFSGPWGKLVPEDGLQEPTLVVATDTGITAALGVVEQEAGRSTPMTLLWLRTHDETFLEVSAVHARVRAAGARFVLAPIPAVGSEVRVEAAVGPVAALAEELRSTLVIAAGDGAVLHPLRERLAGSQVREVRIESFFNNPERKSA